MSTADGENATTNERLEKDVAAVKDEISALSGQITDAIKAFAGTASEHGSTVRDAAHSIEEALEDVDDPPGQHRYRDIRQRGQCPAQYECKKRYSCSFHRRRLRDCRDYLAAAGAAGVGLKSTFGAVWISRSFSTEKFGFSL
jgi:hypothetical protein